MSRRHVRDSQVTCDLCGTTVWQQHWRRHRASATCRGKAQANAIMSEVRARMNAKHWVPMSHPSFKATLDRAGVPMEQAPTFAAYYGGGKATVNEGWWVPDWAEAVVSAANHVADATRGATLRPSTDKRAAVLKLCMKDSEFRDSLHAVLMMVGHTAGRDAIDRALAERNLAFRSEQQDEEPVVSIAVGA